MTKLFGRKFWPKMIPFWIPNVNISSQFCIQKKDPISIPFLNRFWDPLRLLLASLWAPFWNLSGSLGPLWSSWMAPWCAIFLSKACIRCPGVHLAVLQPLLGPFRSHFWSTGGQNSTIWDQNGVNLSETWLISYQKLAKNMPRATS